MAYENFYNFYALLHGLAELSLSNPLTIFIQKTFSYLPTFRTTELYYDRLQDNIYLIK